MILDALINLPTALIGENTLHLADGFDEAAGRNSGLRPQQASSTQPTSLTGNIAKNEVGLSQSKADRAKSMDPPPPGPGGDEEKGTKKPYTNEGTGSTGPGRVAPTPPLQPPVPPKPSCPCTTWPR